MWHPEPAGGRWNEPVRSARTRNRIARALLPFALALAVVTVGVSLAPSAEAEAVPFLRDRSSHERHSRLDLTAQFVPFGVWRVGLAGWLYLPIIPDGFIPSLNDTFGLEFGALGEYYDDSTLLLNTTHSWWGLAPLGGVRWDFHITQGITVFAKGKAGYQLVFGEHYDLNGEPIANNQDHRFVFDAGAGAYFHFGPSVALRLEVGVLSFIAVGISVAL